MKIPDVLYKYRSLSGDGRHFLRQILVDNTVYFCSPESFNDLFDCRVHMRFSGSDLEWERYFESLLSRRSTHLTVEQVKAKANRLVRVERLHRDPDYHRKLMQDVQKATNELGVFSLSAHRDGVRMWSFYADNHRGVCLGFLHRKGPLGPAHAVKYSTTFPSVEFLRDTDRRKMEANLLTKADGWKERVRMARHRLRVWLWTSSLSAATPRRGDLRCQDIASGSRRNPRLGAKEKSPTSSPSSSGEGSGLQPRNRRGRSLGGLDAGSP